MATATEHLLPAAGRCAPISDYALIGDCRSAALISRDGAVDWLCLPHFSGPSVFAALLDRERGGRFRVAPVGPYRVTRRYLPESAVLETLFHTETGLLCLRDLMPLGTETQERLPMQPERELLRLLEVLEGEVTVEAEFQPRPDYGRAPVRLRSRGKLGIACENRGELFLLHSDLPFKVLNDDRALARERLRTGERRALSLTWAGHAPAAVAPLGAEAEARMHRTLEWWQNWSGHCAYRGLHWDEVVRSMITLKLLTFSLSGAVVAAPTASLPEWPGGSRNWDYRYCWLRDASRTLEAFHTLGYREEATGFLAWLIHATRLTRPALQVLYDVYGESRVPESELSHLGGYCGARPVRIGNDAWRQNQLDVYGEVVQAASNYVHGGGRLDRMEQKILVEFGRVVCRRWREPDHGIWEVRGPPQHNTWSKLMCWVALHCLLVLHREGHLRAPEKLFMDELHAIRMAIEEQGYNRELDCYVGRFDSDWLDASLLLMPRYGFTEANAERMRRTFERIDEQLSHDALLYRYLPGSDHLAEEGEGRFAACSFWAVDYLAHAGRLDEARARFDRLLSLGNDLGLLPEEFDDDGKPLGNYPQAFSHAAVITAALALREAGA